MNTLMKLDFPGNIRELENIIEHGFVLCHGSIIKQEHLPPEIQNIHTSGKSSQPAISTPITESIDEEATIISTLQRCNGKISKAAEELGIHRATLWRKIKRFNINPDEMKHL